jgi:hypothetical protein
LTFAEAVEQTSFGNSSRSRVPTDDREKFAGERLHPKTAYSRWRPEAAIRRQAILWATPLESALGASSVRQGLLDPVADWLAELRVDKQVRTASRASEASGHDNVTKYTDQDRSDLDEPTGNIHRATYAGCSEEQGARNQHNRHALRDQPTMPLE